MHSDSEDLLLRKHWALVPGELEEDVSSKHPAADIRSTHSAPTPNIRFPLSKPLITFPRSACISFQRFRYTATVFRTMFNQFTYSKDGFFSQQRLSFAKTLIRGKPWRSHPTSTPRHLKFSNHWYLDNALTFGLIQCENVNSKRRLSFASRI